MTLTQTPDTKPGNYYVTCIDGERHARLAGPFRDDHKAALDIVAAAKKIAEELDPKAVFYSFGTCRTDQDHDRPGVLNDRLGL